MFSATPLSVLCITPCIRYVDIVSVYSSSLVSPSSSSSSDAFFAGFFFFFRFLLLAPVGRATGCSRILRISPSVIFLSVLYLDRSGDGGALKRTKPFFVIATESSVTLHRVGILLDPRQRTNSAK